MSKKIYKTRIALGSFSDGRNRLFMEFADTKGQLQGDLQWTPAWDDVKNLMVKAAEVERQNNPRSVYLEQLANVYYEIAGVSPQERGMWFEEIGKMLRARIIQPNKDPQHKALMMAYWRRMLQAIGVERK